MKRLSIRRFFNCLFTFISLFLFFQAGAGVPAYAADQNWGQITGKVTKEGTTDPIAGLWVSGLQLQYR